MSGAPKEILIKENNGVLSVRIPKEYCQHIDAKDGIKLIILPDYGKHGPFLAIWNPEQQGKIKGEGK